MRVTFSLASCQTGTLRVSLRSFQQRFEVISPTPWQYFATSNFSNYSPSIQEQNASSSLLQGLLTRLSPDGSLRPVSAWNTSLTTTSSFSSSSLMTTPMRFVPSVFCSPSQLIGVQDHLKSYARHYFTRRNILQRRTLKRLLGLLTTRRSLTSFRW